MSVIVTEMDGVKLKITNAEKVLYPADDVTKASLLQYYLNVYNYIEPLITARPLTLIRYPDGIDKPYFYSKNASEYTPEWITQFKIGDINYLNIDKKADLAYVLNLAALELHTMNLKYTQADYPDIMIFDLDPSEGIDFVQIKEICLHLYKYIEFCGLHPYIKTSGSKGLHIYVPLQTGYTVIDVFNAAKNIGEAFCKQFPIATLKISKEKREGKILIDIYRNHASQTCVAPLSTRAKNGVPVSMPILFNHLDSITSSFQFNIFNALDYLKEHHPWHDFYEKAGKLNLQKSLSIKGELNTAASLPMLQPMLAEQSHTVPDSEKYSFELKWDGIRVFIYKQNNEIKLFSRSGRDITSKFPEIVGSMASHTASNFIIDGELISPDSNGAAVFANIISRMHKKSNSVVTYPVLFYCFDILYLNGRDVTKTTLEYRQQMLQSVVTQDKFVKLSQVFEDGENLFEAAKSLGLEGIIAKRKGSMYQTGKRHKEWLKIKVRNTMDVRIIGYTKGNGDRVSNFGALHIAGLGENGLEYLGKIGTGFDQKLLDHIYEIISKKTITSKPVDNKVDEEHNTIWIADGPDCEVQFASVTPNGTLREPVFIKLKSDDE